MVKKIWWIVVLVALFLLVWGLVESYGSPIPPVEMNAPKNPVARVEVGRVITYDFFMDGNRYGHLWVMLATKDAYVEMYGMSVFVRASFVLEKPELPSPAYIKKCGDRYCLAKSRTEIVKNEFLVHIRLGGTLGWHKARVVKIDKERGVAILKILR